MNPSEPHRKLAAILSADAVGYLRLMQADEAATVETLSAYLAAGASEVWIVDPEGETIAVYGPEGARSASSYAVDLSGLFTP